MTEFVIFLGDLALVVVGGVAAVVAGASAGGRLATGVHTVASGAGLLLVPLLGWEVARSDNAFLGLYLIALIALVLGAGLAIAALLRLRHLASAGRVLVAGTVVGLVAAAIGLLWLAARGPDAWATGSGQFGLDVIVVAVLLGLVAYLAGDRLAPGGARIH